MRFRDPALHEQYSLIKKELLSHPNIKQITSSGHLPTSIGSKTGLDWTKRDGREAIRTYNTSVDFNYLNLYEMELVEGRNFSKDFSTDSTQAYIINEKLRDMLGWQSAVGKFLGRGKTPDGAVIGVVKIFHGHSLRQSIKPLFIQLSEKYRRVWYISMRIDTKNIPETIEHIGKVWQTYSTYLFDYSFLDE